jgi:hypothetical protein
VIEIATSARKSSGVLPWGPTNPISGDVQCFRTPHVALGLKGSEAVAAPEKSPGHHRLARPHMYDRTLLILSISLPEWLLPLAVAI